MNPVDISRFKVIYRNKVLNAVAILGWDYKQIANTELFSRGYNELSEMHLLVVGTDGVLIEIFDEAREFQFIPDLKVSS